MAFPALVSATDSQPIIVQPIAMGAFKNPIGGNLFVFAQDPTFNNIVAFVSTDNGDTWTLSVSGPACRVPGDGSNPMFQGFNCVQVGTEIFIVYGSPGVAPVMVTVTFDLPSQAFGAPVASTLGYTPSAGSPVLAQNAFAIGPSGQNIFILAGAVSSESGGVSYPTPYFARFNVGTLAWDATWTAFGPLAFGPNAAAIDASGNIHVIGGGQFIAEESQIVIHADGSFGSINAMSANVVATGINAVCGLTKVFYAAQDGLGNVVVWSAALTDAPVWSSEIAIPGGAVNIQGGPGITIDGANLVVVAITTNGVTQTLTSAVRPAGGGSWIVKIQGNDVNISYPAWVASGSTFIVLTTPSGIGTYFWSFIGGGGGGGGGPIPGGSTIMQQSINQVVLPNPPATHLCRWSGPVRCVCNGVEMDIQTNKESIIV